MKPLKMCMFGVWPERSSYLRREFPYNQEESQPKPKATSLPAPPQTSHALHQLEGN